MADPSENYGSPIPEDILGDVSMAGPEVPVVEIASGTGGRTTVAIGDEEEMGEGGANALPFQEEAIEDAPARVTYIDYLKSPVIGLLVGQGHEQALLTAHQGLLIQSPWFADACAKFSDDVSV
jgi:hypothetical protein